MIRLKDNGLIEHIITFFKILVLIGVIVMIASLSAGIYFGELRGGSEGAVYKEWTPNWEVRELTSEEWDFLEKNGVKLQNRCLMSATAKLPEDAQEYMYLLFNMVYSDAWFYVGEESFSKDEVRYVLFPEAETTWAQTGYSARRTIPLRDGDSEKYLTILQVSDGEKNLMWNKPVSYGDKYGIFRQYLATNFISFISSVFFVVLSVACLLIAIICTMIFRKFFAEMYLFCGIFFMAIWMATNSVTMELFIDNWHLMHDMLYLTDYMLPFCMMLYLDAVQEERYRKVYFICQILYVPLMLLGIVLYITNVCTIHDYFSFTVPVFVLQIVCMIITVIIDVVRKKVERYRYVLKGFLVCSIMGMLQLAEYLADGTTMETNYLLIGGIVLLVMCLLEVGYGTLRFQIERTKAIAANKTKSAVLAKMSHEIRTPIHAIQGMNEMILRTTEDKEIRQYAEDVKRASGVLMELVNDILDFSKIESGKMELAETEYSLAGLFQSVADMFEIKAREKSLKFYYSIDKTLPDRLYGDDIKIREILTNILSNAMKYTPAGSVTFDIKGKEKGNRLLLQVSIKDTGIGIAKEELPKLFSEFERIEKEETRNIEGTGLGISIVSRYLQMMDSALEIDSERGKGTEISFTLVQKIEGRETVGAALDTYIRQVRDKKYRQRFTAPDARIMVVDDKELNLKVFCSLLKNSRMQIDTAASGAECLHLAKQNKYDIIFLDHMMPGMDGVETFHKLSALMEAEVEKVSVVALTANAVSGVRDYYLAEGFDDYLAKPFEAEELDALIYKLLPQEKLQFTEQDASAEDKKAGKLPAIEGIDWEVALSHFRDRENMLETVEIFYRSMLKNAEELKEFLRILGGEAEEKADAFSDYRVQVHSMKSAAKLIGAAELGKLAQRLEDAAREEDLMYVQFASEGFFRKWEQLKEGLEILFPKDLNKKQLQKEEVSQKLLLLKEAMTDLEVETMDALMGEINEFAYEPDMEKDMEQLSALVADLDEEKGSILIDKLLEQLKA